MRSWWTGLSTREQALIALAVALAAVFLLMQVVIAPVGRWRNAANDREELAANGYRLVAQAAASAPAADVAGAGGVPARNALIDTARDLGVDLTFVNEHADGSIEFQAAAAPPEKAFELFGRLDREFGIKIVAADISRSPETPVNVRLQATLAR